VKNQNSEANVRQDHKKLGSEAKQQQAAQNRKSRNQPSGAGFFWFSTL
jgi:hypothetical protein